MHHIANNLPLWTWWQPCWCLITTTDRYIDYNQYANTMTLSPYSNTMLLSPFDIKGKGRMKTKTRFFFSCRKRSFVDLMCTEVTMLPLSSCWIFKHIFQWSTWPFLSPRTSYLHQWSNQVDLHMWLKYPTKWVYTFWLNYPTKWVYKFESSPYMTEYYNFTS